MGIPATYSSRISAVVYGPQGEVQALDACETGSRLVCRPIWVTQLQATLVKGSPGSGERNAESDSRANQLARARVSRRTVRQ